MKIRQHTVAIVMSAALAGAAGAAHADEAAMLTDEILLMDAAAGNGAAKVSAKIAADFQSFAGSRQNAHALVVGLREGTEITLTQPGQPSATFTPPTRPMGYGNVSTSLALARHQLAQQAISSPTPQQLKIALDGGTILLNGKPVAYDGVLQMRADGLGWGEIAHQLGTKLGPVVSGIKAQNAHIASPARANSPAAASAATSGTAARGTATTAAKTRAVGSQGVGKGIVNASGGAAVGAKGKEDAALPTAAGRPSHAGRGVVTAAGQTVAPGAASGAAHGSAHGAVTAAGAGNAGGGGGHGKALGHSK